MSPAVPSAMPPAPAVSSPSFPRGSGRSVLRAVVDLVLPSSCVGCGSPGPVWCSDCAARLVGPAYLTRPSPAPAGLPVVWAMTAYEGEVREAVVAHKEHGLTGLRRPLGSALAVAVAAALPTCTAGREVLVVPAPSRASAIRTRGRDPTRALQQRAVAVLRRDGAPVRGAPVLRLVRRVEDQAGLDLGERARNLGGAVRVAPRLLPYVRGRLVVVVDDVVTTGATLAECVRALESAEGCVVAAAVVAATSRRGR